MIGPLEIQLSGIMGHGKIDFKKGSIGNDFWVVEDLDCLCMPGVATPHLFIKGCGRIPPSVPGNDGIDSGKGFKYRLHSPEAPSSQNRCFPGFDRDFWDQGGIGKGLDLDGSAG